MKLRFVTLLAGLAILPVIGQAHIGSPDIYVDGSAGPYRLFVTIRPPTVIPGVAQLEVRSESAGIDRLAAVPLPMSGPGATFAPVPDQLQRSKQDPQFFTGALWMMAPGSWQVKFTASGKQGTGVVAIPVPSAALATKKMQRGLGALLLVMMTFLVFGVVAMSGAAVREAKLDAGVVPDQSRRASGRNAMVVAFVLVALIIWLGKRWWDSDAATYSNNIYKPLQMTATRHGNELTLSLHDPGWLNTGGSGKRDWSFLPAMQTVDDLVLDHNHLMHLYVIRQSGLDLVFHLHPERTGPGLFKLALPAMPAGSYKLYADVVHQNGFPETMTAPITVPAIRGRALSEDDASGEGTPWQQAPQLSTDFRLPDGYQMRWIGVPQPLRARQPAAFEFELLNPNGQAPKDMSLYMGMLGHAAFVKTDGSVFAHIHPTGSVAMAAFMKAQQQVSSETAPASPMPRANEMDMPGMNMEGENTSEAELPNHVAFPYGLPSPGRYRVFVQMKHGNTVETGIFDAVAQ